MAHTSLLQRILATCRGHEFNTIEDLASQIPEANYTAIETTVISAIRRGLLGGLINEQPLMDGPTVTVSYIRG